MSNETIKNYFKEYLTLDGTEKEKVFRTIIYPFLNKLIDGVLSSYKINYNNLLFNDLRQEAFVKVLKVFNTEETINRVHNIRSYCFIIIRNIIVGEIRKNNTYVKYIEIIENYSDEKNNNKNYEE